MTATVTSATRGDVHLVKALADVPAAVAALVRPGDLVITMGAGSIGQVPAQLQAAA